MFNLLAGNPRPKCRMRKPQERAGTWTSLRSTPGWWPTTEMSEAETTGINTYQSVVLLCVKHEGQVCPLIYPVNRLCVSGSLHHVFQQYLLVIHHLRHVSRVRICRLVLLTRNRSFVAAIWMDWQASTGTITGSGAAAWLVSCNL